MPDTLSGRMREVRLKMGLSQEEVAQRLGVNRASISVYERGGTIPRRSMDAYCREFNISREYLLQGTPPVFMEPDNSLLEQVVESYRLPLFFRALIEQWVGLDEHTQTQIVDFLDRCARMTLAAPPLERIHIRAAADQSGSPEET